MNKTYNYLIFDLDDTLIDNKVSVAHALKYVYQYLEYEFNDAELEKWLIFDDLYWQKWSDKIYELPQNINSLNDKNIYQKVRRFLEYFDNISTIEAFELTNIFCEHLGDIVKINDNAHDTLEYLHKDYTILIGTNGTTKSSHKKLKNTDMYKYIYGIVTSEECFYSKPSTIFFEYLFKKYNIKNKSSVLMIGDNINTDIKGALDFGIDTCWLNSDDKNHNIKTKYKINNLNELKKFL